MEYLKYIYRKYISTRTQPLLPSAFMAILILIAFYIDKSILNISLLKEELPNFEMIYQLRTALVVLISLFFVISVVQLRSLKGNRVYQASASEIWDNWGLLSWSMADPVEKDIISLSMKKLIVWSVLLLSLFFLYVFLAYPNFFYKLSLEDKPIETFSAALYFLSCSLFIYILICINKQLNSNRSLYLIISFLFAFVFFLIGMEEISWCQRIFHIELPELLMTNLQHEMNLHNFSTDPIENAYYFSAFLFLILIPFLNDNSISFKKNSLLYFFMPSRFLIFVSAIFVAYNYDMWNILFMQLSFFLTLFILFHYTWSYINMGDNNFILSLSIIIVVAFTQTLFLVFGDRFVRIWDVTEYKEFFISLSYFMYSCEVLQKAKRIQYSNINNKIENE